MAIVAHAYKTVSNIVNPNKGYKLRSSIHYEYPLYAKVKNVKPSIYNDGIT